MAFLDRLLAARASDFSPMVSTHKPVPVIAHGVQCVPLVLFLYRQRSRRLYRNQSSAWCVCQGNSPSRRKRHPQNTHLFRQRSASVYLTVGVARIAIRRHTSPCEHQALDADRDVCGVRWILPIIQRGVSLIASFLIVGVADSAAISSWIMMFCSRERRSI